MFVKNRYSLPAEQTEFLASVKLLRQNRYGGCGPGQWRPDHSIVK